MINNDQLILTLELNKNEKIKIYSDDNLQSIDPYSYATVILHKEDQLYPLLSEFLFPLHHFLLALQKLLRKGLLDDLKLDDSIIQDIGYLWNVWINGNDTSLVYTTDKNNYTYWIGQEYELSSGEYVSWIYNDEQGNLIFEITPAYPLGYIDQDNDQEKENYKKWMESYKPTFKTIISQKLAEFWIEQSQQILDIIDENSKKYE